jgi:putative transport protein
VTGKGVVGRTLKDLSVEDEAQGIYVRRLRNQTAIMIKPETVIESGDILTIVSTKRNVDDAIKRIGVADVPSDVTDMAFVSAGIVLGALIGIPAFAFGKAEIGLSLSVGVLLGGLVWGWLHSVRPIIGRIPSLTLWIFESLGLTGFIAVVGLTAGVDFVHGIRESGLTLLLAGLVTVLIPHLVGILVGYHIFHMHPGILLGVCAGAGALPHRLLPPFKKPPRVPYRHSVTASVMLLATCC